MIEDFIVYQTYSANGNGCCRSECRLFTNQWIKFYCARSTRMLLKHYVHTYVYEALGLFAPPAEGWNVNWIRRSVVSRVDEPVTTACNYANVSSCTCMRMKSCLKIITLRLFSLSLNTRLMHVLTAVKTLLCKFKRNLQRSTATVETNM